MYIHLRDYMGYVNEMGDLTSRDEAFKVIEELGAANQQDKPKIRLASSKQVGGSHYKRMDIQPWDVVDFGPKEQAIGFYRYNALKYIMRAGEKGAAKEDFQDRKSVV